MKVGETNNLSCDTFVVRLFRKRNIPLDKQFKGKFTCQQNKKSVMFNSLNDFFNKVEKVRKELS